MLCSNNSSIHIPGTRASRAAANRAWSSGALPRARAAATRTSAAVGASSTRPVPSAIVRRPAPLSFIFSLLQSSIYPQLPHGLAARVHVGSSGERGRTGPETQQLEHCRHGERRGDCVSIGHLERDPESFLRKEGAIHAFGADLCDHAGRVRAHHLGTRPTLTRDELGVTQHGFHDCGLRIAAWTRAFRIRNPHSPVSRTPTPCFSVAAQSTPRHTRPRQS